MRVCIALFFAFLFVSLPSNAEENVLGTTGGERLVLGPSSYRVLQSSTFYNGLQAAGTYTYAADSDCIRIIATISSSSLGACGAAHLDPMLSKDTTLTKLTLLLGTALSSSSVYGCKARIYANGSAIAASEVLIEPASGVATAANTTYTTSFSHRVPAGSFFSVQFANGASCAAGGTCRCGTGAETIGIQIHGVEH